MRRPSEEIEEVDTSLQTAQAQGLIWSFAMLIVLGSTAYFFINVIGGWTATGVLIPAVSMVAAVSAALSADRILQAFTKIRR